MLWRRLWIVALCGAPWTATATTLLPLDAEEVDARASAVILATLGEPSSWWDPEPGMVRTDIPLQDLEWIRSGGFERLPERITYTGGEYENIGTVVTGMPAWPIGERVLLFLADDGQTEVCPTVGWTQGLFIVQPSGQLKTLEGEYLGLDETGRLIRDADPQQRLSVDALHQEVGR